MKRRLPPLKSLIALESVVRTGSVTAAAAELAVTHSAVSKQLAVLEQWMGRGAFADRRRGMVPTPETIRLAEAAGRAFDDLQIAVDQVAPEPGETAPLQVVAPAAFAMRWLIPRLPLFRPTRRAIDVMVRPSHSRENWLELPFDVAIRPAGSVPERLRPVSLFPEELGLFISRNAAPLKLENNIQPAQLLEVMSLIDVRSRRHDTARWLAHAGIERAASLKGQSYAHLHVAIEAMLAGKGAIVASALILEDLLCRKEIIEPWPSLRISGAGYVFVGAPSANNLQASRLFAEWLSGMTGNSIQDV